MLALAACSSSPGNGDRDGAAGGTGGMSAEGGAGGTSGAGRDGGDTDGSAGGGGTSGGTGGSSGRDGGETDGAAGSGGGSGGTSGGTGGGGSGGGSGGTGGNVSPCDDDGDCDDDQFCNGEEACDPDATTADERGCRKGTPPSCSDGFTCTLDACDEAGDACTHTKRDNRCDDTKFCTGVEVCDPDHAEANAATGCVPDQTVDPVVGPCNDDIACTADGCDDIGDECIHTEQDSRCSGPGTNDPTGDYCNVETCDPLDGAADARGCVSAARDCADAFGCTGDTCDEDLDNCIHAPNDTICDDGFCDGADTCDPDVGCVEDAPPDCDDGIDCTDDSCDSGLEACVNQFDHDFCSNGAFCDGIEACAPNIQGADGRGCILGDVPDCGDAYDCTADACNPDLNGGLGACENEADDNFCRDTQFCNGSERCLPGSPGANEDGCADGPTPTCNDGVPCTTDTCDPLADPGGGILGECVQTPDDLFCNDGKMCDGDEQCQPLLGIADANGCIEGVPFTCNDMRSCTIDGCNATLDECVYSPVNARCNDLAFCDGTDVDGAETCDPTDAGADGTTGCLSDPSTPCADDGLACTDELCSEALDACSASLDQAYCQGIDPALVCSGAGGGDMSGCEPGTVCFGPGDCDVSDPCAPESCVNNVCVPGTPPSCSDGVPCTDDFCDAGHPNANGLTGCVNVTNDSLCDDGDPCTGDEVCHPTLGCAIVPDPLVCNDGVACTNDSCVAGFGCSFDPDDSNCSDSFCNPEQCDSQTGCELIGARDCGDGIACTVDTCNETNDVCEHTPDDVACDNGEFCNGSETCDVEFGCQPGVAPNCNDGVTCSFDSCDEAGDACQHFYDSLMCAAMEICTAGGCQTGAACTASTAGACDDGVFCNGVEMCSSADETPGVCLPGTPVSCPPSGGCNNICSEALETCVPVQVDGDSDGFSDQTCGGADCDDSNPAINPNATEVCDGVDNDCDFSVDNGLSPPGASCSGSAQCCSGACVGGICLADPGSCAAITDPCAADFECCTGICDTYVDGQQRCLAASGACGLSGSACTVAADCCSLGCVGGFCSANPADTCRGQTQACPLGDVQCCSNNCVGGFCASPAETSCKVSGESCTSNGNCCSGYCFPDVGDRRCAPHDTCRAGGEICTQDGDCCTGTQLAGSMPGDEQGCDDVKGQCVIMGSCATTGEPCTGVRACCSNLCVDAGWGVGICEFLSGCRPFGEVCTLDQQCCSGTVNPNTPTGCDDPDPGEDNVQRCINPSGCVDPGEMCAAGGSGASNNCCELKSKGCTPTGQGVSRCNYTEMCIMVGDICQFQEQCCDNKPCLPQPDGFFRCADACVEEGGLCGSHADCCPGFICAEGTCLPNNLGCTPVGQGCVASDECCSTFCGGGACSQPP